MEACRAPREGPAPPQPECVHINLGFPPDLSESHSFSWASSYVALSPTPTRKGGSACHKTYDLWRCFRKTLPPRPGGHSKGWAAALRRRVTTQRRGTFTLLPSPPLLHPAGSGRTVLSTGSCQRRSLPPPLLVDGTCGHPGFPSESGRQGIPQPCTTEGGHSPFCPYSPLWSGRRWECRGATF